MNTTEVAVALTAAADYLHEHGWTQGTFKNANGAVCTDGALRAVIPYEQIRPFRPRVSQLYIHTKQALEEVIDRSVILWNDALDPLTGAAQAEAALREAARRAT